MFHRKACQIFEKQKKSILLLCAAMSIYALNLIALGPVVTRLANERMIGQAQAGFIFSVHFIGFILFSLIGAIIADKVGKKRVIEWSLLGFCAGFLFFSIVNDFKAECLIMFILGGCGGIVECLGSALAADLNQSNPENAVNQLQIFFSIGAVISPLLISLFLSQLTFWKSFYIILAISSVILAVLMHHDIIDRPEYIVSQRLRLKDLSKILKEPGFLIMCFCMFAYTGAEVGVWGWLSSLLQQKVFFSEILSGLGVSLFWLFMTFGRSISGWLLPRLGAQKLVIILAVFSAFVSLAAVFVADWKILLILVAGAGLGCSSQFPLIATIGSRMTILPSGATFTILMVSGNAGSSVIPYIMGLTGNIVGLDKSLIIPVVLFAMISIGLLISSKFADITINIKSISHGQPNQALKKGSAANNNSN